MKNAAYWFSAVIITEAMRQEGGIGERGVRDWRGRDLRGMV
jgi:hypothetical protein